MEDISDTRSVYYIAYYMEGSCMKDLKDIWFLIVVKAVLATIGVMAVVIGVSKLLH